MSDNKVNLQALFDEQSSQPSQASYRSSEQQKTVASKVHKGKVISEQAKARMREHWAIRKAQGLHGGWILSAETRAKQSEGQKKRWEENPYIPTEEVNKKRSEGMKKVWAERKANAEPKPPKAVEPPKKRGRPRTRPLPDPNQAPKRRGRPPKVSNH
jgi:hypothetical protein